MWRCCANCPKKRPDRRKAVRAKGEQVPGSVRLKQGGLGDVETKHESQQDVQTIDAIDITRIMQAIPHRYPFLLIDRMVDIRLGEEATGIKNVSVNEPFFPGHFPVRPVMPGVLIVEAMAQTAATLVVLTLGKAFEGKVVYFMTIENAKFRKPVEPGDQLRIHVVKERHRSNVWKFRGVARVDGVSVAEATFSAMIMG